MNGFPRTFDTCLENDFNVASATQNNTFEPSGNSEDREVKGHNQVRITLILFDRSEEFTGPF